jgi:hypothetical protein
MKLMISFPPEDEHPYSGEMDLIMGIHFRKKESNFFGGRTRKSLFHDKQLYHSKMG